MIEPLCTPLNSLVVERVGDAAAKIPTAAMVVGALEGLVEPEALVEVLLYSPGYAG